MAWHITYRYRPLNFATCTFGPEVSVTDPPCDPSCFTAAAPHPVPFGGPGLYFVTRLFHPDTCTFDEPVCQKAPACPLLPDCP